MDGIILAGGLGSRLDPVTREIPKALIPVQGRPLTDHVYDVLVRAGVERVILSLGHLSQGVLDRYTPFFNVGDREIPSHFVTDEQNGTGAWIKGCLDAGHELSDPMIVVNGDNLCSVDFEPVLKQHHESGAAVTIVLTELDDVTAYGVADLDGTRIRQFVEKPPAGTEPSKLINTGYYIFSRRAIELCRDLYPEGSDTNWKVMLEHDVFPRLAAADALHGFVSSGLWFDTGTFDRWARVIDEWKLAWTAS